MHPALSRAFATLEANVVFSKRRRVSVETMRKRWALRCKKAFLEGLRNAVTTGKRRKAVIQYFGGQLRARAWQAWRDLCELAREGRARAAKSAQQRALYVRNQAFLEWRALRRAHVRRRASLTSHVAARSQALLAGSFREWRLRVGHVERKEERLRRAERFNDRRLCHVAFRDWRAWHRIKKSKLWALSRSLFPFVVLRNQIVKIYWSVGKRVPTTALQMIRELRNQKTWLQIC
jgi:hypothetical protein